jgi:hypothetical protein
MFYCILSDKYTYYHILKSKEQEKDSGITRQKQEAFAVWPKTGYRRENRRKKHKITPILCFLRFDGRREPIKALFML